MQIIPAIDIFGGKCVRLAEGAFSRRTDYDITPAAMAQEFLNAGAQHLHVVDLEGAREGRVVNWKALEDLLPISGLEVQVGGGIRTLGEAKRLLTLGASRIVVGSLAVRSPEIIAQWVKELGAEKVCAALDLKDGQIASGGWVAMESNTLGAFVDSMKEIGIRRIISTDIRRDGLLAGPNVVLYRRLLEAYPSIEWIASGGVRSKEDVAELASLGVYGTIIGKAFYEKLIPLEELFR
jgi:phosphoribosylformimino-5-aminoimidazole carboxamide ribotide isomerase